MPEIKNKRKSKNSNIKNSSVFIRTQIICFLMYSAIFIITSLICLATDIDKIYDYYITLALFICTSLAAGYYGAFLQKSKGLLAGVLYALPSNMILMLVSLTFTHFKTDMNFIISVIMLIISSGVGGVISVNKRRRR